MYTVLWIVHILVGLALIGLVLLQRGKGSDIGAAFGSGASTTVFGSQGSATFLSRTTAVLATVFFITSLTLAMISGKRIEPQSVTEVAQPPAPVTAPAPPERPADVPVVPGEGAKP